MGCWIKYLPGGQKLIGDDFAVDRKLVSWSKTEYLNLQKVELHESGKMLCIQGVGTYWQADVFELSLETSKQKKTKRQISRLITDIDRRFYIFLNTNHLIISTTQIPNVSQIYTIQPKDIGMWITAELNMLNLQSSFSIRKGKRV